MDDCRSYCTYSTAYTLADGSRFFGGYGRCRRGDPACLGSEAMDLMGVSKGKKTTDTDPAGVWPVDRCPCVFFNTAKRGVCAVRSNKTGLWPYLLITRRSLMRAFLPVSARR